MKRTFEAIGILVLLFGSFLYTEEVSTTSKMSDDLLNEIKNKSFSYKVEPIEGVVKDNTIIPGINGKDVDIYESYEKMREVGYFNDKLLVYKKVLVKNTLKAHKDKYIISGNSSKNEVSLIFKVNNNDNVESIINVLDKKNIKGTFYVTSTFLENNYNLITQLIQNGHTIGNLSNNEDYNDSDFVWMKTIFTSIKNQKNNYCYLEKPNKKVIDVCKVQNSYTIMPIVIKDMPFIRIKENLKAGGIYSLKVNSETKEELENIINYIISKGYKIKSLEKLLYE